MLHVSVVLFSGIKYTIFKTQNYIYIYIYIYICWFIHCATSRKAADSISDGVTGIFHRNNPSGCTMALGLTHLLTEMSTRNKSLGVKAAGA
jgi:hypothetical protein